jgi:hypothetical protein
LVEKMPELKEWETFYVIVGSSAGALIGLQFVVLTLIAERPPAHAAEASAAFATPSVVHFGVVLFLSAVLSAPWHAMAILVVIVGCVGGAGIGYTLIVARRMRLQDAYRPVFEDWLFHAVLPLAAYATLVVAAFVTGSNPRRGLFLVGAVTLLFLFVGIHNAWDGVTYNAFVLRGGQSKHHSNQ